MNQKQIDKTRELIEDIRELINKLYADEWVLVGGLSPEESSMPGGQNYEVNGFVENADETGEASVYPIADIGPWDDIENKNIAEYIVATQPNNMEILLDTLENLLADTEEYEFNTYSRRAFLNYLENHHYPQSLNHDYDGSCPCCVWEGKIDGKTFGFSSSCWRVSLDESDTQELRVWGDVENIEELAIALKKSLDNQNWYNPYRIVYSKNKEDYTKN